MHTMDAQTAPGDKAALAVLQFWPDANCASLSTGASLTSNATCINMRQNLVNNVRTAMSCNLYKSQVCSAVEQALSGVLKNNGSTYGRVLDQTAQIYLVNMLNNVQNIFHRSYLASQDESTKLSRFSWYQTINTAILINFLLNYVDRWLDPYQPGYKMLWHFGLKILLVLFSVFYPMSIAIRDQLNAWTIVLVFVPAFVSFVWYELLLPKSFRPW